MSVPAVPPSSRWSRAGRVVEWVVLVLAMFGFTYNILFTSLAIWTTGRIALVLLTPLVLRPLVREYWRFTMQYRVFMLVSLIAFAISIIHWVVGGDSTLMSRAFHLLFYTLYGAVLFVEVCRRRRWSVEALFGAATVLQSGMIIYSLFSPTYRTWLAGVANQLGNISLEDSIRPPGFSNGGGAAMSLIQGLGVFVLLLYASRSTDRRARLACHIGVVLNMAACLLSGRTGLLMSLAAIGLVVLFAPSAYRRSLGLFVLVATAVLAAAAPLMLSILREHVPNFDRLSNWALEFFVSGTKTKSVTNLQEQYLPPITDETIAGTGAVIGRGGTNASGADSGYVQTYFGLGLPLTIVWYLVIFGTFFQLGWRTTIRRLMLPLVVLAMVVEIKEPFVFKWTFPFVIFMLGMTYARTTATPDDAKSRAPG